MSVLFTPSKNMTGQYQVGDDVSFAFVASTFALSLFALSVLDGNDTPMDVDNVDQCASPTSSPLVAANSPSSNDTSRSRSLLVSLALMFYFAVMAMVVVSADPGLLA